jgi:hypothetical protein
MHRIDPPSSNPKPGLPWWFFPALAYASTVAAVWGFSTVACGGVVRGALGTLLTLCLMMFVSLKVLAVVLLVVAGSAGAALALSAHRWFRDRRELLFFLLPVASLGIGAGVALGFEPQVTCAFGPWR